MSVNRGGEGLIVMSLLLLPQSQQPLSDKTSFHPNSTPPGTFPTLYIRGLASTLAPSPPNEPTRVGSTALGGALVGLSATEMVRARLPSRKAKTLGFFVANYLSSTGAGLGLVSELLTFLSP
jgi:hypothetical protein